MKNQNHNKYFSHFILLILSINVFNCTSVQQTSRKDIITKSEIDSIDSYKKGYESLLMKADKALNKKYKSVVDKKIIPPSGDKHDYMSRAVYYWPNPKTNSGLPWIYKDGKYNTKSFKETDHKYYYEAMEAIRDLSLAYHISQDSIYAYKAIEIIDQWFINKQTKMNPNLNYAQGIPGKYDGTKSGIIDSRAVLWVIQGIDYIRPSGMFHKDEEKMFKDWCTVYLDWLLTSEFGKAEAASLNNHGTFYDLQVIGFADYVGKDMIAKEKLEEVKSSRIEKQIKPDGSQPLELDRTRSHMYSVFNLSALIEIAEYGEKYDIDLWNYKTENCGSIKNAVDFLVENSTSKSANKFKDKINTKNMMRIIPKAKMKYESEYNDFIEKETKKSKNVDLTNIYYIN